MARVARRVVAKNGFQSEVSVIDKRSDELGEQHSNALHVLMHRGHFHPAASWSCLVLLSLSEALFRVLLVHFELESCTFGTTGGEEILLYSGATTSIYYYVHWLLSAVVCSAEEQRASTSNQREAKRRDKMGCSVLPDMAGKADVIVTVSDPGSNRVVVVTFSNPLAE
eukprot:scaffold31365_cov22-Tisochrysis_lutea.AAC.3